MKFCRAILMSIIAAISLHSALCIAGTIQIQTELTAFIGKPAWLITIRDLDHQKTYSHVLNFTSGSQTWTIPTKSYYYLITISNLRAYTYRSKYNDYKSYEVSNFCDIESHGRIIRGKSLNIVLKGTLSKYESDYTCDLQYY